MNVAQVVGATSPTGDRFDEPSDLLTLIRRDLPMCFSDWLGGLSPSVWPDGRFTAHIGDVRAGLRALFEECETPFDDPAQWWIEDVAALAEQYVTVSGEDIVDVRLERIFHNACWKFHVDNVRVRLITTYFGPGTQLVPLKLREQAHVQQRDYDGPLRSLGTDEIAIFRGGEAGVVHRSPPVADKGLNRSMLCLNTPSDISPPLWQS